MKNNKIMLTLCLCVTSFYAYADFEPDFTDQQLPPVNIQEIISEVKELLKPQVQIVAPDALASESIAQKPTAQATLVPVTQANTTPCTGNGATSSSVDGVSKPANPSVVERISSSQQEFAGYSSSSSDKPMSHINSGKSDYRAVLAIVVITGSFLLYKLLYPSKP